MFNWNAAKRKITKAGVFVVAGLGVACTTTPSSGAGKSQIPDEYAQEENVQTYGVIEDELERYEWTGKQYADPRFAAELDNSPLNPDPDYKPVLASSVPPSGEGVGETTGHSSKIKLSKASKGQGSKQAGSRRASAKASKKRSR